MNILITGIYGRLGYNLAHYFTAAGHVVYGTYHKYLPEQAEFSSFFLGLEQSSELLLSLQKSGQKPDFIIHAAAMTAVDGAQANPERAMLINATATGVICDYASALGVPLVYISTDFVFDGKCGNYYEESPPAPISVYGSSKLAGENHVKNLKKHYILRMTPLAHQFRLIHHGRSIVDWLLEASQSGEEVTLFSDKICSPVTSFEVAAVIAEAIAGKLDYGLYHLGLRESLSLFAIGLHLKDFLHLPVKIRPVQHPDNAYGAIRPRFCNLKSSKIPEYSLSQILNSVLRCCGI